jgi:Fe-S oxidoreductase
MLRRKRDNLQAKANEESNRQTIITNCPSCISGLGRNRDLNIVPQHLAVLLAESLGGANWQKDLHTLLQTAEVVTF